MSAARPRPPFPAPRPVLRPTWPERTQFLEEARTAYPTLTRTALERESEQIQTAIALGMHRWPPRVALAPGDLAPRYPANFDWRYPACFFALPTVRRVHSSQLLLRYALRQTMQQAQDAATLGGDLLYMTYRWHVAGRHAYYLDQTTFELLRSTPLPQVTPDRLQPPRESFLLALPNIGVTLTVDGDPVPQPIDGLLVAFDRTDATPGVTREMMLVVTARSARDPNDDNVATFSVVLDPTRSVQALDVRCAHGDPLLGRLMTRLALAVCLYLQSEHPYLEPVPAPADEPHLISCNATKRRKAEQRAARRSRLGFTWVRAADAALLADTGGEPRDFPNGQPASTLHRRSWQLREPVRVEPHYRNQPYGPGRAFRKRIYIDAYWRGPDDFADAVHARSTVIHPARPAHERRVGH